LTLRRAGVFHRGRFGRNLRYFSAIGWSQPQQLMEITQNFC